MKGRLRHSQLTLGRDDGPETPAPKRPFDAGLNGQDEMLMTMVTLYLALWFSCFFVHLCHLI